MPLIWVGLVFVLSMVEFAAPLAIELSVLTCYISGFQIGLLSPLNDGVNSFAIADLQFGLLLYSGRHSMASITGEDHEKSLRLF